MTRVQILSQLRMILGDLYLSEYSLLSQTIYNRNCQLLKKQLIITFDLTKVSEIDIPLERFSMIRELIDWLLERKSGIDDMSISEQLNIIITGKSGVGKSSFLNYLVGKDVFETGIGEPVTKNYFEEIIFESQDNVKYHLFDTKGIEPTTTIEHKEKILSKIEDCDQSGNIYKWIHTVYYCFAASSKRIEPFEIKFIKELQKNVTVVILLTKKDLVLPSDLKNIQDQIYSELGTTVQVISVCSIDKITRRGCSHPEGKEDVLKASFLGLWNKLSNTLPSDIVEIILKSPIDLKLKSSYNELWKSYYEEQTHGLSLYEISCLPNLYDLKLDGLYQEDLIELKKIIYGVTNLFNSYRSIKYDLESYRADCRRKQEEVFNFYKKVNREKPQILHDHKTEDAIKNIISIFIDNFSKIDKACDDLIKDVTIVGRSNTLVEWVFSDDHRGKTRDDYEKLRELLSNVFEVIKNNVDTYINVYEAELYQYGQCCIRNEESELNVGVETYQINSYEELSDIEKAYYGIIKDLCKGKVGDEDRKAIEGIRANLKINPIKAEAIENLMKKSFSIAVLN